MNSRGTPWGTYAKIADVLRARIAVGDLAPGSSLPSEASLCEEFAVVRNPVRRALAALEDESLIKMLPGKGRLVRGGEPIRCKYQRIADDLRSRIENDELTVGDALPSEAAIVKEYGVARGTAREALAALEAEELIEARHGRGRFVRNRAVREG